MKPTNSEGALAKREEPLVPGRALVDVSTLDLTPIDPALLSSHLNAARESAKAYAQRAKADRTVETYEWAWTNFVAWCMRRNLNPCPASPDTVALFAAVAVQDGVEPARSRPGFIPKAPKAISTSTLDIYLAAIDHGHRAARLPPPTKTPDLVEVLEGVRRSHGRRPRKVGWLSETQLRQVLDALPSGFRGLRDRAILLTAYASGGRRRSEVVALDVADLRAVPEGLIWTIRKSKVDQYGHGFLVPLAREAEPPLPSPAKTLEEWLSAAKITSGPAFRTVNRHGGVGGTALKAAAVAAIIKEAVERIGLDSRLFAGHTLRASFVTNKHRAGWQIDRIKRHTGHESIQQLFEYIREAELFSTAR